MTLTFKQKRRNKKLAKIFNILLYVMFAMFIFSLVLLFTGVVSAKTTSPVVGMSIIFMPIISAVILGGIGQSYGMSRVQYKMKIRVYREYRHFNFALDYIQQDKFTEAIDLYNSMPVGYLREFIYSHLLAYFSLGKHTEGNKTQAIERINGLREKYCIHNVKF